MAVMQNSIIFGGVDSADFGIYIGGEGTFNAPKRAVEMISIPGRNGAFALDKGRFENIEVTYSAFNFEPDLDTFSAQLEAFRNAICSQKGYQRLTDTFHPDEYRMAAYIDGLEIKPVNFNTASTFDIVFDCKPQRYLLSGEEAFAVTSGQTITNPTRFESSPMLEVTGYGEIGVGDDTIVVNDTAIGDIYISEGGTITRRDNELSITLPITFETRDLNGGDKFYISDATATIQSTVKSGYTTDGCSASSFDTAATTNATGTSKAMRIKYSMIFIYNEGTLPAQSDSNSATFFDRWTHGGTAGSNNAIFTISGSYTGGNTLTLTLTIQLSECFDSLTVKSLTLPRVRAKSTKSALGTPTYIDLDIGEAWNTDSGEPVSANNAVIFPSTLPTLKPGATEFNLPGSVTDLKVIPRWWKI